MLIDAKCYRSVLLSLCVCHHADCPCQCMCTQPALVQWTVSTTAVTAVWLHCRYRALVHHLLFYPRAAPATASQQIASWKFASTSLLCCSCPEEP